MLINADILKKVNESIMCGEYMTLDDVVEITGFDSSILKEVAGDPTMKIASVTSFFELADAYIVELRKRLKMLSECFVTINKWQRERGIITDERDNGAIVWDDKLTKKVEGTI